VHKILVERIIQRYQKAESLFLPPAAPPHLLPGAGDRPWITGQHCHIQAANVYAQFQRISRDDSQNFAFAQALFNFSPSGWQVTAAISPDEPFILQAFSISSLR